MPDTSAMLEEMSGCAYRLGVAFAGEAERTEDFKRRLELFRLFDRCFFAVRVATALQLRLRREARMDASADRFVERESDAETEVLHEAEAPERPDPVETGDERPERSERFEADREREPASLPIFFETLQGVANDAAALPAPRPAELPTLREFLARTAGSAPARPANPLRDRLTGSAAAALAEPPSRRATGPPSGS